MSENQEPKVNVLVFSDTLSLAKSLQTIYSEDKLQVFKSYPTSDLVKTVEYLEKFKIHLIVFDDKLKQYSQEFFAQLKDKTQAPVYYVSYDTNVLIDPILTQGFTDVLFTPLDSLLWLQKVQIDTKISLGGKMLYDEQCVVPMKVSFEVNTMNISEYSAVLSSEHSISIGSSINLTHQDESGKYLKTSGVVIGCEMSETYYSVKVLFRGTSPAVVQSLRKIMKQQFIKKNKSA